MSPGARAGSRFRQAGRAGASTFPSGLAVPRSANPWGPLRFTWFRSGRSPCGSIHARAGLTGQPMALFRVSCSGHARIRRSWRLCPFPSRAAFAIASGASSFSTSFQAITPSEECSGGRFRCLEAAPCGRVAQAWQPRLIHSLPFWRWISGDNSPPRIAAAKECCCRVRFRCGAARISPQITDRVGPAGAGGAR